uniref:L-Fucosyltransferase n=1 Tax=Setaria digitata TaxID=48799 RepID=A0A915PVZ9_9BILA
MLIEEEKEKGKNDDCYRYLLATRKGLIILISTITLSLLLLPSANWSFYTKHVAETNHLDRSSLIQITRIFPQGGEDVKFNQPWTLPNVKIIEGLEDIDQSKRYLLSNFSWSPGLGNLMFQYASLRAIAERYNAKLIVPVKCKLRRGFWLDAIIVSNELNTELIRRFSSNEHRFDEKLIRRQFTFLPEIIQRADEYLQEAKSEKLRSEAVISTSLRHRDQVNIIQDFYAADGYVYVGIHIRHGIDVTANSRNIKYGHTTATKDYITNAMNYFRSKFRKLIFLISSDNKHWVKTNINYINKGEIYIISSGYREIDMAALIRCNHTIMSTGTFSWWTAYLTNGSVVYYNGWPRRERIISLELIKFRYPFGYVEVNRKIGQDLLVPYTGREVSLVCEN